MASCDHSQRSFDLGARQIVVATSLPIGRGAVNLCRCLNLRRSAGGPALAERRDHSRVIRLALGDRVTQRPCGFGGAAASSSVAMAIPTARLLSTALNFAVSAELFRPGGMNARRFQFGVRVDRLVSPLEQPAQLIACCARLPGVKSDGRIDPARSARASSGPSAARKSGTQHLRTRPRSCRRRRRLRQATG
jgi:hypothetical protein